MKSCANSSLRLALILSLAVGPLRAQTPQTSQNQVTVDASAQIPPPETGYLNLGGTSSTGHLLQVTSRYLVLDGRPWLPVMGELHYSRLPASEWEDEILKMKAAGIDIVSTYIFWIHHEEIEGQFDWTGQRDLRRFVQLCAKHGMYVWVRPGPWGHGEVRNGGFPDWLNRLPNTRTNDPQYIHYVDRFFNQIGVQLQGLMFKDGGPVIGAQLENEYGLHGPGRGAEHILKLKQIALAAGIDPPLFSVTGWPSLDFPSREVIPVSGGYPDGFWFGSQTELPPSMNYLFNFNRELGDMGATVPFDDPTGKVDLKHDPYLAAEEGGGMATAYHRRPVLSADDIAALTLTGIGSGVNLYGYYMFHGGTNPRGKLTTLQESQATGYPNDLPKLDYDFEAPIGASGQERESYRKTRMLHLFLNAYGAELAPMTAFAPAQRTRDAADTSAPRVAVRSNGRSGFVFVNNYVRQLEMPARKGFQLKLKLSAEELLVPAKPIDVPANTYFAWPVNLAVGKATLRYSTAQLLTGIDTPSGRLIVFFAIPGVAPEFCFDGSAVLSIDAAGATVTRSNSIIEVAGVHPSMNTMINLIDTTGVAVKLLVLTQDEAEQTTVLKFGQQEHLAMTPSSILFDGRQLRLRSTLSPIQHVALLPGIRAAQRKPDHAGLWEVFTLSQPERHLHLEATQTQTATAQPKMDMGPYFEWRKSAVPTVQPEAAFEHASIWQLRWAMPDMKGLSEVLLRLDYSGDIGHLYSSSSTLLNDNFFNGLPWEVGMKRFSSAGPSTSLTLKLLPMPSVAPVYLDQHARSLLGSDTATPRLAHATLVPEYESLLPVP